MKTEREAYYKIFLERNPETAFWLGQGFDPRSSRALADSGNRTLDDLRGLTKERFFAIPGLGKRGYARVVRILGHELYSDRKYWQDRGLRPTTVSALLKHGIKDVDAVRGYTRSQIASLDGIAETIIADIEANLQFQFPTATGYWIALGAPAWVANTLARRYHLKSIEDVERIGLGTLRRKIKSSAIHNFLAAAVHLANARREGGKAK